jgi:hypothetical protein
MLHSLNESLQFQLAIGPDYENEFYSKRGSKNNIIAAKLKPVPKKSKIETEPISSDPAILKPLPTNQGNLKIKTK